jgi:bifunctional non-homologous end joining protein LigD
MAKKTSAKIAVDRQLKRYRGMRDFSVTAEPRGKAPRSSQPLLPFVVQKHQASRLHYDFRLGWNGVLKSWAVAKGPSLNPADKRLAVQVEDHPIEYGGFEGAIPKGQYGGGTVMIWDQGEWEPHGDVDHGLRDGHLKFTLRGRKLRGGWALVRMSGAAAQAAKPNWLLIKERDRFATDSSKPAVTEAHPRSAVTNRGIEQIAADQDHVWNSKASSASKPKSQESAPRPRSSAKPARRPSAKPAMEPSHSKASSFSQTPREKLPAFIPPQLALTTREPPTSDAWIHELKLDGYRIQIHLNRTTTRSHSAQSVRLLTRNGLDWTGRMPAIARAASKLKAGTALVDGEAVVIEPSGLSSFAALQAAFQAGRQKRIDYFAFDLLHLDGHNLRSLPLTRRKQILAEMVIKSGESSGLHLSESFPVPGDEMFHQACRLHAEGIVSKLAASPYKSGRNGSWLKIKCARQQEFVIGGFTLPSKAGQGIGALLLGYYEKGKLIYAGRSGTGFTQKMRLDLRDKLDQLLAKSSPFAATSNPAGRNARWVKPKLVAQIAFATWTTDNMVRQAAFKGLREDKQAKEVVREETVGATRASHSPARNVAAKVNRKSQSRPPSGGLSNFHLTHPDKQLDESSGLTKQALADYYIAVSSHLLPHIANRPLSIVRCPEGSSKPCFFQKHTGSSLPDGIETVPVRDLKTGATENYITVSSVEGLVGLAQMGVMELHPWGSQNNELDKPDRIIFDLDPDTLIPWKVLADCARGVRALLQKVGLKSFVKLTGGKGLHVVAPIRAEHTWPEVKEFAHNVANRIERFQPDLIISKMTKSARKGKIYLDYLRNNCGSTAVAPFSPRARAGVPVAVPLSWKELDAPKVPLFTVANFKRWKSRLAHDPWKEMTKLDQALSNTRFDDQFNVKQ